jgi:hypothetical protein
MRDSPADERLGRKVGLEEHEQTERAQRLREQAHAQHDGRYRADQIGQRCRKRLEVAPLADLVGVLGEVRRSAERVIEESGDYQQPHYKLEARPPRLQKKLHVDALVELLEIAKKEALAPASGHHGRDFFGSVHELAGESGTRLPRSQMSATRQKRRGERRARQG